MNTKRGLNNILYGILSQVITMGISIIVPRLVLINLGSETNGLLHSISTVFTYLSLLEAGVPFTIVWNGAEEQRCVSQQIRSMDELIGLMPRLLSAREAEGLSGAELFCRSSGEAVLSHILYITGRIPEQAYLLGRFGRLTVLSSGETDAAAVRFDSVHYAEQLSELEI